MGVRDPNRPVCGRCGADDLVSAPKALVQKSRGTQLSVLAITTMHFCRSCDADPLDAYLSAPGGRLVLPDQLPTTPGDHRPSVVDDRRLLIAARGASNAQAVLTARALGHGARVTTRSMTSSGLAKTPSAVEVVTRTASIPRPSKVVANSVTATRPLRPCSCRIATRHSGPSGALARGRWVSALSIERFSRCSLP
jgi:hypothetical protein